MSSFHNTLRAHCSSRFYPLTPENKSDLRWWWHFVPSYNGVSLIKTNPWIHDSLSFSTEACGSGAGGYFSGKFFHTPFPHPILLLYGHDINTLELLTIMVALKLWGTTLCGQRVIISCDNENSVLALNSGRSRTAGMQCCLREICFLSAVFDFEIRADHVPGVSNAIADHLSRWHLSPSHQAYFEALTSDTPTIFIPCPPKLFNFNVSFWTWVKLIVLPSPFFRFCYHQLCKRFRGFLPSTSSLSRGHPSPGLRPGYHVQSPLAVESFSMLLSRLPVGPSAHLFIYNFLFPCLPLAVHVIVLLYP